MSFKTNEGADRTIGTPVGPGFPGLEMARHSGTATGLQPSPAVDFYAPAYYVFAMIRSWKNAPTRKFWEGDRSGFRGMDEEFAIELLAALNVAKSLKDLSPLKSVGLHKLKGDRQRQWAMTVNGRWRICFAFKDGGALDVEIVDYHKG